MYGMTEREVLALIPRDQYPESIEKLRRAFTVTQILPPTLALVVLPPGRSQSIPDIPAVTFYLDNVPAEILDNLTATERTFVQAWLARRAAKQRPGDQLPWDSPGYTPPS